MRKKLVDPYNGDPYKPNVSVQLDKIMYYVPTEITYTLVHMYIHPDYPRNTYMLVSSIPPKYPHSTVNIFRKITWWIANLEVQIQCWL